MNTTKRGYASIGLYNPKTNANVGGAMRAASCFGADLILVQGKRYKTQCTDTTKSYKHIPLMHVDSIIDNIPYDCIPIAIEITDDAKLIDNFIHPERALYIFGPEDGSIPKNIIERCKYTLCINSKYCLNLAATTNVVLFHRNLMTT